MPPFAYGSVVWILLDNVPARVVLVERDPVDERYFVLEPEHDQSRSRFYRKPGRIFGTREEALAAVRP
jgi:hypothetical protein